MSGTHEERTDRTVQKVHLAPLWSSAAGAAGLALIGWLSGLSAVGWLAGLLYLGVSNALLARGLRRRRTARFGPANAVTAVRSTLVALVTAVVATSFTAPISVTLLLGLTIPALALDALDGWVARRTGTISELGARFDMEVDAFLLLTLAAYVAPRVGWWVIIVGVLRYAFVVAGWMLPWMRAQLPDRHWRKVVTAAAGIALAIAASGLMPWWVEYAACLLALALLIESFGRDVLWLVVHREQAAEAAGRLV